MNWIGERVPDAAARCGLARPLLVALVVGALTGLAPSCSGDDSGGGMETTPCIELRSSAVPAPLTVTADDGGSGDCNLLYVDLIVTDVDGLYAASFVAEFPADLVVFRGASAVGSILSSGNTALDVKAAETSPGVLSVGVTRVGAATGVNVVGGQRLLRLSFLRLAGKGSGALSFDGGKLLDAATPPQEIPNTVWVGGTIGIVQL